VSTNANPRAKQNGAHAWWPAACVLSVIIASTGDPAALSCDANHDGRADVVGAERLRSRARALSDRGELGEAIDVATRAVELAPDDPQSWAVLGYLHLRAGHGLAAAASITTCK
jgi:Flp pilus assembly protein TadD